MPQDIMRYHLQNICRNMTNILTNRTDMESTTSSNMNLHVFFTNSIVIKIKVVDRAVDHYDIELIFSKIEISFYQ